MKALILDGLKREHITIGNIYSILINELTERGWKSDTFVLQDTDIASCKGCFGCWVVTPGICVNRDDAERILTKFMQSDLIIALTHVTFGGYSSELKKAFDRLIPILLPFFKRINNEIHHKPRYSTYPHLAVVGVMSHPDEESEHIFKTLISRNALNFHAPRHGSVIIFSGQSKEKMQEKIKAMLSAIGGV